MSSPATPAPPTPSPGLRAAWRRLDHRQRRVGAAVILVLAAMALPWYSETTVAQRSPGSIVRSSGSISGFTGLAFIEASLLIVLIGVLALLWGRGTGRRFTLPYPDGSLICAAAVWMGLLLVYRLFARPHGVDSAHEQSVVGINWGIFGALLALGVLFAAGLDLRRHGPRNPVPGEPAPRPPGSHPDVDPATMVVRPARDEPPTAPVAIREDEQPTTRLPVRDDEQPTAQIPVDDEPATRVRPAATPLGDDQPTRRSPALWASDDPPAEFVPPPRRRTPTPPTRSGGEPAGPDRDTWPSRMRRTPRPTAPPKPDRDRRD